MELAAFCFKYTCMPKMMHNDLWVYSNSKYPATTCCLSVTVLFLDNVVPNIIPNQPFNQCVIFKFWWFTKKVVYQHLDKVVIYPGCFKLDTMSSKNVNLTSNMNMVMQALQFDIINLHARNSYIVVGLLHSHAEFGFIIEIYSLWFS